MRGYFDEDEPEAERPRRDTELTLGAGALLGLFFGLVLLCGLCFGVGYAVGHRSSAHGPAAAAQPGPQTAAPDQEPLQANGSIPKPSAAAEAPVPPSTPPSDSGAQPSPGDGGANPAAAAQGSPPASQSNPPASAPPSAAAAQPQVRPALPGAASAPQPAPPSAAQNVRPALPSPPLMVQIAAVSHAEDAEVLVNALRRRGYAVVARREPEDGLIHVRIGPFYSREEANRWRDKLLGDGYNAQVQP